MQKLPGTACKQAKLLLQRRGSSKRHTAELCEELAWVWGGRASWSRAGLRMCRGVARAGLSRWTQSARCSPAHLHWRACWRRAYFFKQHYSAATSAALIVHSSELLSKAVLFYECC